VNEYLQRLVTRTDAGADAMRPVVRSTSPIADEDQRLGVLGFGGVTFGTAASDETILGEHAVPTGDVRPPSPSAIPGAAQVSGATVQRKMAGAPQPSPASTNIGRAAGAPVRRDLAQGPVDIADKGAEQRALRQEPPALAPRASPTAIPAGQDKPRTPISAAPVSDSESAAVPFSRPRELARQPTVSTRPRQAEEATSAPTPAAPIAAPRSLPRRVAEVGPQQLEPSHRPLDALRQRESTSREMVASGEEREQGPRVVIGRINVELVPPSAEPRKTAASAPRPLTAESVSVIGPLGGNDPPSLRFGLRHR
jgi:hypothetical protein